MKILRNHHVIAVHDLDTSVRFFTQVLGFVQVFDGGGWRFIRRDNCMIMLGHCPDAIGPAQLGDHSYFGYLLVDDVDEYWAEVTAHDVDVISPLSDRPWGMREFGIRTPDGHRLMIGQDLEEDR